MKINKLDIFVIVIVLLLSGLFFVIFGGSIFEEDGRILQVFTEGKLYAEYNLDLLDDTKILAVDGKYGSLKLEISKNGVKVVEADCRDGLCKNKMIRKSGHSVVCVPGRILISIVADKAAHIDSVAY